MLLVAVERLKLRLNEEPRKKLVAYLLGAQVDQGEGYAPGDPDFGGWDMEGGQNAPRRSTGTNTSVGASVAEALALHQSAATQAALKNFRDWLARCQNGPGDGGFFFHADRAHDGNKAGWLDADSVQGGEPKSLRAHPRSYGSATADGLRGLKSCGVALDDPAFLAALQWLQVHRSYSVVPGFEQSPDPSWNEGLLFYYWYALGKTMNDLPNDLRQAAASQMRDPIVARQNANGSWQNTSARMREDDPLIATGLALIALASIDRWAK
jgi:hypothetical protein